VSMAKRFYEKNPTVCQAIETLFMMPVNVQVKLSQVLLDLIHQNYNGKQRMSDYKSLGPDKSLALYKSKRRKRSYDNCPYLHEAMNYLMILSPQEQEQVATDILNMTQLIQDCLEWYQMLALQPDPRQLAKLMDSYAEGGEAAGRTLLEEAQNAYLEGSDNTATRPVMTADMRILR